MMTCGMCSHPSSGDPPAPAVPDFSGEWVSSAYEGDVDAFLAEMGAGLMARLGARLRRYDVDNTVRIFKQKGNQLDIDVDTYNTADVRGRRRYTQMLTVGGGQQVCEDEEGVVMVEPAWEYRGRDAPVLRLEITEQDGSKPRTARHWIDGSELVIEYTTRSGCSVKWRCRRRVGTGPAKAPPVMLNPPPPPRAELMKNGRPDFSGTWISQRYDGDIDGFFEEMGIGKAGRTAMSAMNYGIGMVEKVIVQTGDDLEISDAWPTGPVTQKFSVGAGEQVTVGTQGKELYVTPDWEHTHVLRVATQPFDRAATPNGPMRYFYEGDHMVVMFESVTGRTVKYLYSRKQ